MPMKPGTNEAIIEGVLYEKITRNFDDGAVAGELVIEVPIKFDGEEFNSLIPVSFYTKPQTKEGKPNVAYKGIKTIIDTAKSLQEVDGDYTKADRIRLRSGQLGENMFFAQDDRFVSFARIRGNFFDRVKETDCRAQAVFKIKMIVSNIQSEEVKHNGEVIDTGRIIVTGDIVQYNGEIDEIKFVVANKKHIDTVQKNWSIGDTVAASGIIKYTTIETIEEEEEADNFGEAIPTSVTRRVREFIITNGSNVPLEGYEEDDIADAKRSRKVRINKLKDKQAEKEETKPAESKPKSGRDW